ncbi:hypothetical protein [Pseudomonas sp. BN607]|nr:hypothetical protein [Pseudomonas sp. BN607]
MNRLISDMEELIRRTVGPSVNLRVALKQNRSALEAAWACR